jgi:hypothetical protein
MSRFISSIGSLAHAGWIVRLFLGLTLLAAAGFKAYALWIDAEPPDLIFSSSRAQLAIVEIEGVMGLWLVSGVYPRASMLVGCAFFGFLASVSLYLALAGRSSCGCFGRISVDPWATFAFDVAACLALAVARPPAEMPDPSRWLHALGRTSLRVSGLLLIAGTFFYLVVNDPGGALGRLRGDSVTIEPPVCDCGSGSVGSERVVQVQITNRSDHSIRVTGASADCRCVATRSLPLSLAQGETRAIDVAAQFLGSPGRFRHRFKLFTDDEAHPVVVAHIAGRVTPTEQ